MQEIQKTRQEYIQALADVQGKVYQMGLRAEAAVQRALQSLLENDHALADRVMREEDDLDDMLIDIEDDGCLRRACRQHRRVGRLPRNGGENTDEEGKIREVTEQAVPSKLRVSALNLDGAHTSTISP